MKTVNIGRRKEAQTRSSRSLGDASSVCNTLLCLSLFYFILNSLSLQHRQMEKYLWWQCHNGSIRVSAWLNLNTVNRMTETGLFALLLVEKDGHEWRRS